MKRFLIIPLIHADTLSCTDLSQALHIPIVPYNEKP